jgi:hypothetical protein
LHPIAKAALFAYATRHRQRRSWPGSTSRANLYREDDDFSPPFDLAIEAEFPDIRAVGMGRPTLYTPALADLILDELSRTGSAVPGCASTRGSPCCRKGCSENMGLRGFDARRA